MVTREDRATLITKWLKIIGITIGISVLVAIVSGIFNDVYGYENSRQTQLVKKTDMELAQKVNAILKKLLYTQGITQDAIKLQVDFNSPSDFNVNIYWDSKLETHVIHFGLGQIYFNAKYPSQTAWLLGHEIGHYVLNHPWPRKSPEDSRQKEKEADLFGKNLARRAGYDECAGALWFKRLLDNNMGHGGVTHPTHEQRYEYLRCK